MGGGGGGDYSQIAKLTATDATVDDSFGISVAIDGDFVVAGALRSQRAGTGRPWAARSGWRQRPGGGASASLR